MDFFYNRTAYRFLDVEIPKCFISLDTLFPASKSIKEIDLAGNICRRMADIEYYANEIGNILKSKADLWNKTILVGTFLVDYYVTCKSLFDAVAITLNYIYKLGLNEKEQDFTKKGIWKRLKEKNLHTKYEPFKELNCTVRDWRDAAVHRVTPFVIPVGPGEPGKIPDEKFSIKLVNKKGVSMYDLVTQKNKPNFINPLYHHSKWKKLLLRLCEQICEDIGNSLEI